MKQRREPTKDARLAAAIVMWFILLLILATIGGVWLKVFWFGWVFVQ